MDPPRLDLAELVHRMNFALDRVPILRATVLLSSRRRRPAGPRREAHTLPFPAVNLTGRPITPVLPPDGRTEVRLWNEPGRWRCETDSVLANGLRAPVHLEVRDGDRVLEWSSHAGAVTRVEPDAFESPIEELLTATYYDEALKLEIVDRARIAARDAVTLRGVPDPDAEPMLELEGADEVILALDIETGLVLRCELRSRGATYSTVGVSELVVGEPADPQLFSTDPPAGVPHNAADLEPSEVASRAPFTIWAPVGAQAPRHMTFLRHVEHASIHVVYTVEHGDDLIVVGLSDGGRAKIEPPMDVEHVVRAGGIEFLVNGEDDATSLRYVRDGTSIRMEGLPEDALIRFALALEPVNATS